MGIFEQEPNRTSKNKNFVIKIQGSNNMRLNKE